MQEQDIRSQLTPGARVAVTQQVALRQQAWTTTVRGTLVAFEQRPTGSWFAHGQGGRLWLDRLTLRKDDGEISVLNLDSGTRIEIESTPAPTP